MAAQPQGCFIKLYCDDGKEEEYELHSIHYKLHPTGVAVCTFNTPKNMNCLAINQQWEMFALLDHMRRDGDVKVAIWTGSGKAFNAGADLRGDGTIYVPKHARKSMLARGMGPVQGDFVLKPHTIAFWDFPKPSICAVNGLAVGGAANMALTNQHDLVICSTDARFMYPFPKLGFTPELGSSYMLPYLIGLARTKEVFYLSDWFSAEQAKEWGLVNKVVAPDQLLPEAMQLAERLCLLHPAAVQQSKKILNSHIRSKLEQILDDESAVINASLLATGGPPQVGKYMKKQDELIKQLKAKL
ncbi:unnamed protein product [Prorocentrum cordatum]|uniref:3-hydroxyisobutyryl-CoA hydrolase n=1 Tax=Prorocentrum cordatum TaxID=2364126 RepID=A0ABN9WTH1_9DINO|nr:unnamed protein product [Polarella glacialis]|mmetsp:Transcript_16951/g.45364  ORF Transcript_16951/g.45364 Transcript_16951/m.45364 type:complete len:300 (+) Transcript_16951:93-992(+)